MVTEPGGSVPTLPCQPLNRSSRSGNRWSAPGPGGSWCHSAATLDCSLRYHLTSSESFRKVCCKSVIASERELPSPKAPSLFPARHHFGSSGVLLGSGGAGAPDLNAFDAFRGWKAGSFGASSPSTMELARPYPALEHLEVLYADETRFFPMSSVYQLVSVMDDATAEQRRAQERVLLFEYARLPNPDRYPEGSPGGLPPGVESAHTEPGPEARLAWRNQCYKLLEDFCRGPLTDAEARTVGCVHCNRRYDEVDLYRCVACRTSFVCWEHGMFPACLEGLEIL
eukprot:4889253-Amphidinium_carterae.1